MEARNELFVAQKNAEIEVDALRRQVSLKDAQIEQLEKEQAKNKAKHEKQVGELERELARNREMFDAHQDNMRKSTEAHLLAKENKIAEVRAALHHRDEQLSAATAAHQELAAQLQAARETAAGLRAEVEEQGGKVRELAARVEERTAELAEVEEKMGKELEEAEIVHGEQIDQKNEQIETYMLENEALQQRLAALQAEAESRREELQESLAVSQKQQSDLYIRNTHLLTELDAKHH
jgi:chromosome segregation ATPase